MYIYAYSTYICVCKYTHAYIPLLIYIFMYVCNHFFATVVWARDRWRGTPFGASRQMPYATIRAQVLTIVYNMYGVHVYILNMSYALHVYMYMHNICVYIQYVNI